MSDKKTDNEQQDGDEWMHALSGDDHAGPEDAKLIRALLQAHEETTQRRFSDEDFEYAKVNLQKRLDVDDCAESAETTEAYTKSNVVSIFTRSRREIKNWSMRTTGTLLAASAAVVAVGILTFGGNIGGVDACPAGAIMCYGEVDGIRGSGAGENTIYVDSPDAYGRELATLLTEKEIPFVLFGETESPYERVLNVQVDGIPDTEGVWDVLHDIGIDEALSSVVVIRLLTE